jgi:hypothetical protein
MARHEHLHCRLPPAGFSRRACDVTLAAGWFPLGDELTSGRPDQKEGFYLGSEDGESPLPLHVRFLLYLCPCLTVWRVYLCAFILRVRCVLAAYSLLSGQ